jgi:serpin B
MKNAFFETLMNSLVKLISREKRDTDIEPDDPEFPEPYTEILEPYNITTKVYQKEVIDSANRFAFDLFKPVLSGAGSTENIMISPFSISSALSMMLNGAKGETLKTMKKTLGLERKTLDQINRTYLKLMTEMIPVDKRIVIEIANSVWVGKRFILKKPFIRKLQTRYKAEPRNIDVTDPYAVNIVNGWIAEKTHDKITNMLDSLDPELTMLLINVIYFNGKWSCPFYEDDTHDEPFYITPSTPKDVPMMHESEHFRVARSDNSTIVELPYGQANYTMVVVLPDENVTAFEVANALTPSVWQNWMNILVNNEQNVDLSMPRFKYKYTRILNDDLNRLGMGIAMTTQADFSNITDQNIMISGVLHQSFIETNEKGTEAFSISSLPFLTGMGEPPPIVKVILDRPFLYFIREISTGTILFMGRVSDPTNN